MTFSELLQEIKKIGFEEQRKEAEDYLELVVSTDSVPQLHPVLESFFGPAFKPAGMNPSKDAKKHTDHLGGIEKNQVLYYAERDNLSNCAMLWPWSNGTRVTVKVAQGLLRK